MTTQEITQIYLHSTGLSWDKYPAQNANLEDIDIDMVKRYIQKAKETGRKKIAEDEDPVLVLEKMNLITRGQPTWAAVLLFCKEPQKIISQAAIHCGRFKEGNIVIDDRMITGTLFEQIDEGMDFIHKNINVEFVMTGRPERDQIWDYPLEALREALIKAVMYVKKNGNITNKEYQEVCNTSERTSSRDLAELVSSGLFEQIGITGKGTAYSLRRQRRHNDAIKTP